MSVDIIYTFLALALVGVGLVAGRKRRKPDLANPAPAIEFARRLERHKALREEFMLWAADELRRRAAEETLAVQIAKLECSKAADAKAAIERLKKASQPN